MWDVQAVSQVMELETSLHTLKLDLNGKVSSEATMVCAMCNIETACTYCVVRIHFLSAGRNGIRIKGEVEPH